LGGGVLVEPKIDVGDGPPVGGALMDVGVIVGLTPKPGVREAVGVNVVVTVGGSVGITCTAVAPHALASKATRVMSIK
jgi:hypothetical protein